MNRIIRGVYAYGRFLCEKYFVKCENNDCRLRTEIVVMTIIGSQISGRRMSHYAHTFTHAVYLDLYLINEPNISSLFFTTLFAFK